MKLSEQQNSELQKFLDLTNSPVRKFAPLVNYFMLIGLMSDSHDNLTQIKKAVDYFNGKKVGIVLHAGDIISPFCSNELKRLKAKFYAVFGNNDGERVLWYDNIAGWGEIFEDYFETVIEGEKLLMMHEPRQIEALAQSGRYGIIVFGHTHKPEKRYLGHTVVVNPGECGGWLYGKSTIATLKLPEKEVEIIELK